MANDITSINAVGFVFILVMGVFIIFLPRRLAALPLIMTACFITFGQKLSVGPLEFTAIRIIIFFGFFRILIRKEFAAVTFNSIDKVIILFAATLALCCFLRRMEFDNFTHALGLAYNSLGSYLLFRAFVSNIDDLYTIFHMLIFVMFPLAVFMLIEKETGRNIFSMFGGVPEYTIIRDGRLRCQGAFAHPILAGTFGATSIPFFLALWVSGKGKKLTIVLGIIFASIVTITSASSGPVLAYAAVILGIFMWRLRDSMMMVRRIALLMILMLHMIMNGPVWSIIGKLGHYMGGTGWHRVMLIDAAIAHFSEWWLCGTDYTRHWLPTGVSWSPNHTDITNQFIGIGVQGGILPVIIFVVVLIFCFSAIGKKIKEIDPDDFKLRFTVWCLGVALFSHISVFTAVSYFDQIIVFWYLLLAMVAALAVNTDQIENYQVINKTQLLTASD